MSDAVKAEVRAVRDLRTGINSYAEQLREAITSARREMAAVLANAEQEVERRRRTHLRAQQELQAAQEALRRATDEAVAACRAAVAAAQARESEARQRLEAARRAHRRLGEVSRDLLRVFQHADGAVSQHGSASSSILASLDSKLGEITRGGLAARAKSAITTVGVVAEVAITVMDVSKAAGNVSQGRIPTADRPTTLTEMAEDRQNDDHQLWREVETDELRRASTREPEELA